MIRRAELARERPRSPRSAHAVSGLAFVLCFAPAVLDTAHAEQSGDMVRIEGGTLTPLVKTLPSAITVRDFALDKRPVTRAEFAVFLSSHPEWWRQPTRPLYFDETYLADWTSSASIPVPADAPVTRVSWYAARAYCRERGKRLPTAAEWEYAAQASESSRDGTKDPGFAARILAWYAERRSPDRPVGQWKNVWGVYDMHGLIWEWVEDFNGEFTSGDSRGDNAQDPSAFCGGAALNVNDASKIQYASFMRYALRGSLQGSFSLRDLGFRCAGAVQ